VRRVLVVLGVGVVFATLIGGAYLVGRSSVAGPVEPSPSPSISSSPADPCAFAPTLRPLHRRAIAVWRLANRQAAAATGGGAAYRHAYRDAAGQLTALRSQLIEIPAPAEQEVARAVILMRQGIARLQTSAEKLSVLTSYQGFPAADTAYTEAAALLSAAERHLKAAGC
jgi:hypothetical protein